MNADTAVVVTIYDNVSLQVAQKSQPFTELNH